MEMWIHTVGPEDRKSIRLVSIDMRAAYYHAARNRLPHAQVVVDRSRVMKQPFRLRAFAVLGAFHANM